MQKTLSIIVLLLSFGFSFAIAQTSAGNALLLDGSDDYASPLTPNVSGASEGTIEFWFSMNPGYGDQQFGMQASVIPVRTVIGLK